MRWGVFDWDGGMDDGAVIFENWVAWIILMIVRCSQKRGCSELALSDLMIEYSSANAPR